MFFSVPQADLGAICGRFGPITIGHASLFDRSLTRCRRTCIIVGSAQERCTLRNPLSIETRIKLIRESYPGVPENQLCIFGLNDMTNELDISTDWGKYLKENIVARMHKFPDVMFYGNDEFRSRWFAHEDLINTEETVVPRSTIPVSATQSRGLLLINDEQGWQKISPQMIHFRFKDIRDELMATPIYQKIYDEVRRYKHMDLDAFMKVYKVYEKADYEQKLTEIQHNKL